MCSASQEGCAAGVRSWGWLREEHVQYEPGAEGPTFLGFLSDVVWKSLSWGFLLLLAPQWQGGVAVFLSGGQAWSLMTWMPFSQGGRVKEEGCAETGGTVDEARSSGHRQRGEQTNCFGNLQTQLSGPTDLSGLVSIEPFAAGWVRGAGV